MGCVAVAAEHGQSVVVVAHGSRGRGLVGHGRGGGGALHSVLVYVEKLLFVVLYLARVDTCQLVIGI